MRFRFPRKTNGVKINQIKNRDRRTLIFKRETTRLPRLTSFGEIPGRASTNADARSYFDLKGAEFDSFVRALTSCELRGIRDA